MYVFLIVYKYTYIYITLTLFTIELVIGTVMNNYIKLFKNVIQDIMTLNI